MLTYAPLFYVDTMLPFRLLLTLLLRRHTRLMLSFAARFMFFAMPANMPLLAADIYLPPLLTQ